MFTRVTFYLLAALAAFLISCSKEQRDEKDTTTARQVAPEKASTEKADSVSISDTSRAGKYFVQAEKFSEQAKYDSAIVYFEKARRLYETEANWEKYVRCCGKIGASFNDKVDYNQAVSYLHQGLEVGVKKLGENHSEMAGIYFHLGRAHYLKRVYDQAIKFFQQALSIQSVALGEQHADVARSYSRMGVVYRRQGDYDRALAFFNKALAIGRTTLGEQHLGVAGIYQSLGNVYFDQGDYDEALHCYQKSLAIDSTHLGAQHLAVAYDYNNIGNAYQMKGDFTQALWFLEKSVSIKRAILGEQHSDVAMGYGNMSEIYRKTGDQDQALRFYQKALAIHLASPGTYHNELAETFASIGEVYESQNDYDQALAFYQRAIGASVLEFSNRTPLDNPNLDNILFEQTLLAVLAKKAQALAKRFAKHSHHLRDLETAVSTFQLASQLIDQMRYGYKAEGSKLFHAEQATGIYDQAIQTALRLYSATQNNEHTNTAFLFAEKSKTGVMLEALSEAEAKQFASIPDSLLQMEKQLRLDLAFYDNSLLEERLKSAGADSAKIACWQDKLFGLKQAYDALLLRFEKEYPDYYNLKYQVKTVSVPEVQQQLLDDRTALVEYFTGKDSIFIFAITKNDFTIKTSIKDSLFAPQLAHLRQGIIEQNFTQYTQAAYRLYQTLLAPIANMIEGKTLVIVPDGALSAIPFEALLTQAVNPAGGLKDYLKLPYLVEARAMSYAYSATLLQQMQSRKNREVKRDYLAFAPLFPEGLPAGTRGADFVKENFVYDSSQTAPATRLRSYLPATKTEVTGIFARFENSYHLFERWFGDKSRVYLEQEAKEEKIKSADLSSCRFLHFATHGLVNEKNPKLSGLILVQEDTTSKEDGILRLGEIYNLNLNADLVVLSACETGLGQIAQGEGIIGLTRGFLYAGAANVLMSLWQVSDMTTSDLMVDFYDKMLAGMSKAEALREAKRQMIRRDPGYAKPYYWAPFILVGK